MTERDVLVRYCLRLFTLAEELGNVSEACRLMGVEISGAGRVRRSRRLGPPRSSRRPAGQRFVSLGT